MSWKNTFLFFAYQVSRFSCNTIERQRNWSNYERWKQSFKPERNSVNDKSAWITFDAIDYLIKWCRPEYSIFEFGGGGSTLFFCEKVKLVVTVEHQRMWFRILEKIIRAKEYQNWQGHLIEPEPVNAWDSLDASDPAHFKSNSPDQKGMNFERYARMIDAFDNDFFDLVLVDGRARTSCIAQAIPKLKPGGLLVIDNAERSYYIQAFKEVFASKFTTELNTHAPVPYTPDFSTTLILKKI